MKWVYKFQLVLSFIVQLVVFYCFDIMARLGQDFAAARVDSISVIKSYGRATGG